MDEDEDSRADLAFLKVPQVGAVRASDDPWEPFQLVDADGKVVQAVSEYLKDLQAAGRAALTQRSYAIRPQDLRGSRDCLVAV